MPAFPTADDPREALDRSAEAFQAWESEILLRTAAWIAILQGLIGLVAVTMSRGRETAPAGIAAAALAVAGAVVLPWVRSWSMRIVVAAAIIAVCLHLLARVETGRSDGLWPNEKQVHATVACLLYGATGMLLLRRSRIGRDAMLALAGGWVLLLSAPVLRFYLERGTRSSAQDFRTDAVISALFLPHAFLCAILVSRAGRSVFSQAASTEPLAPLLSLRRARGSARAWAAVILIPLSCVGAIVFLGELGAVLQGVW